MKINNTEITQPSEMNVSIQTVGSEIQAFSGKITTDVIATKRIVDCKWRGLYASAMSVILNAVSSSVVSLTYFDPVLAHERTGNFIVSEKSAPAYSLVSGKEIWSELAITFTEQG